MPWHDRFLPKHDRVPLKLCQNDVEDVLVHKSFPVTFSGKGEKFLDFSVITKNWLSFSNITFSPICPPGNPQLVFKYILHVNNTQLSLVWS